MIKPFRQLSPEVKKWILEIQSRDYRPIPHKQGAQWSPPPWWCLSSKGGKIIEWGQLRSKRIVWGYFPPRTEAELASIKLALEGIPGDLSKWMLESLAKYSPQVWSHDYQEFLDFREDERKAGRLYKSPKDARKAYRLSYLQRPSGELVVRIAGNFEITPSFPMWAESLTGNSGDRDVEKLPEGRMDTPHRECVCTKHIHWRDRLCKECRLKYSNDSTTWPDWVTMLVASEQKEADRLKNREFKYVDGVQIGFDEPYIDEPIVSEETNPDNPDGWTDYEDSRGDKKEGIKTEKRAQSKTPAHSDPLAKRPEIDPARRADREGRPDEVDSEIDLDKNNNIYRDVVENAIDLEAALAHLTSREYLVFELFRAGLTQAKVGVSLGITQQGAAKILKKALATLRRWL